MNAELKESFSRIKPVCDVVMVCPSAESVAAFMARVTELKKDALQELQQYILFPFITHVKSTEIEKNFELQRKLIDAMRVVLEKVSINSFEMCIKIEACLLAVVFEKSKDGMIADVPEELKLSVMRCLTALMLNLEKGFRIQFLKTQIPMIAQAVFVAVHLAKLEKLRTLRLAAVKCVMAHTAIHPRFTNDKYQFVDSNLETLVVNMLTGILPGLLAGLQDVATWPDNPGHAIVVAALEAIHRSMCLTMNDKYLKKKPDVTAEDFAKMYQNKMKTNDNDVSFKDTSLKSCKDIKIRGPQWFAMAGDRLTLITKSVAVLRTHEHFKVRRELAIYCARVILECNSTMPKSVPLALDVLISLCKDEYPAVSEYSAKAVNTFFNTSSPETQLKTMDTLCENFCATLTTLPRVLNNIDAGRKLSSLSLLHGYIEVLCEAGGAVGGQEGGRRPERLTTVLSVPERMHALCTTLLEAAACTHLSILKQHADRDVTAAPPVNSPWYKLRHLDTPECEKRLRDTCQLLGNAECADLLLDRLLDMFDTRRDCEIIYIINCVGSASNSSLSFVCRILDMYIEENVWYLPLEVGTGEPPLTEHDTLDVSVYNPRAWIKDSVPDLYEGATETRYTDISYQTPRVVIQRDPNKCGTLAEAQTNMVLSCLLTEGVGTMARRLMDKYQPYLYKTLCLILERVGSKYEMLHLAGLKAINDIAFACSCASVAELISINADYFTDQVTKKLKKAWNSESALQILSVVMEYSDHSILNCLYGIVQDVLVQSCDKYHDRDLCAYLQVFLTFIQCLYKWFPPNESKSCSGSTEKDTNPDVIDLLGDLVDYVENQEEAERLLNIEQMERESGKSVEEMYREDQKKKEDNIFDYDDRVTHETPPLPYHITVTVTILKRCLNFISSKQRDESILALQVLNLGLPLLKPYDDELLPLVHQTWAPLVSTFESKEPVVLRRAFNLLVTMASVSKDFIRQRTVKDVLPHIQTFLRKSSSDSYLKDAGSAYRSSHAFNLQLTALAALPSLVVDLRLEDQRLEETLASADHYLSNKQPKPLQVLAVKLYKTMLVYDYGATWHHLRELCDNNHVLQPPNMLSNLQGVILKPAVGTPYQPNDTDLENNIKLIFES